MNAHTSRRGARIDAAADRMMGLDSAVYGDERERRVVLEACSFGFTLGLYACLIAAVVAGAVGSVGASITLLVLAVLPSWAALWYAKRRHVDLELLAMRDRRAHRRGLATALLAVLAWAATLAYLGFAGRPLLPVADLFTPGLGSGGSGDTLQGLAVGGVVGGILGLVMLVVANRRKARAAAAEADAPDEEF